LGGFSAHAGQSDLLKWFSTLAPSRPQVILTHGEDTPRKALGAQIQQRYGLSPRLPVMGEVVVLQ
jgi:metallo-beta-lactamase family protein